MANVAIIGGGGYVGLAYAAAFARLGHDVTALDIDATKIQLLAGGRSPIYEPGLDELLREGLASGRIRFTTDFAVACPDAEFAFICVGTPPDAAGRADMRFISAAARDIGRAARGHTIVVNKSTMPIGSAHYVLSILRENAPEDASFAVVSNPEFLREGSALEDIFHPDRIVIGADDFATAERVADLYAPLGAPVVFTDPRSAELVKYASNAYLATRISFINEIAQIGDRLDVDIAAVVRGLGLDKRIGPHFLQPGAGFGGSCLPKDVRALGRMAEDAGLEPRLLSAVLDVNATMRHLIVDKLSGHLGGLSGKTVAVLGLAFKPDTDDVREAPALGVIEQLLAAGATVRATDPVATRGVAAAQPGVEFVDDPYLAATGADAVVIMTEWAEYRSIDLDRLANAMRGRLLVDGRNAIDPAAAVASDLIYQGVGRRTMMPRTLAVGAVEPALMIAFPDVVDIDTVAAPAVRVG